MSDAGSNWMTEFLLDDCRRQVDGSLDDRPAESLDDRPVEYQVDRPAEYLVDRPVEYQVDHPVGFLVRRQVECPAGRPVDLFVGPSKSRQLNLHRCSVESRPDD